MSLDELIKAADRLDTPDLDALLQQVVYLRARRKTPVLPENEAQLLLRINQGIPADLLAQYQILRQQREAETLTEPEYDRLIQLSTQIEQIGTQRLEALYEFKYSNRQGRQDRSDPRLLKKSGI